MKLPIDQFEQIRQRCEQCYQQAELFFQQTFPRPSIQFNVRGKAAGMAYLQTNELRFNPILLQENPQAFLTQVVPHEISHLLCHQLFAARKPKPHGKEWQAIMVQVFGAPPHTTHQFNVDSVKGRTFTYTCGCQSIELTIRRHNKVQRGQGEYGCRRCGQLLRYTPA